MTKSESPKKILFWGITILFPFIILLLIEVGFRLANYNEESQDLFIELPNHPEFLVTNPQYPARYFPGFLPQVAPSVFLKEKPENTFRVFVFGGSSTQGFPYNFYNAFSNQLKQSMLIETQGLNIEVINLGMTAVNSYVIWDLKDEVFEYEPDAIVVYAGHNEYYGSFGVGSSQFGLGRNVALKRLILRLKDSYFYQFIEELMKPEGEQPSRQTLMARVVKESEIPLDGNIYQAGVDQFRSNIGDFMNYFEKREVPVYIGNIVSNLKDQAPLSDNEEALIAYKEGNHLFEQGETEQAYESYLKAKALDATRFRGTEAVNEAISELVEEYSGHFVDIVTLANETAESGIPDNSIFTDHLHPNWRFNQLIGETFFEAMLNEEVLGSNHLNNPVADQVTEVSQFEKTYSTVPVARLESGFPFVKGISESEELNRYNRVIRNLERKSYIDSIAVVTWEQQRQVTLSLTDAINYASRQKDTLSVVQHYLELANWQLFNTDLLKKGINFGVNTRELDPYTVKMLHNILSVEREDPYFANTLSAIYLLNQQLDQAGYWLSKSEEIDPDSRDLLYNFARFHVLNGDTLQAQEYYQRFMNLTRQN
jgi:tetratricopeptide (TPR) repeat protein